MQLDALVRQAARFPGTASVRVCRVQSDFEAIFAHSDHEVLRSASAAKINLLIAVAQAAHDGQIDLEELVHRDSVAPVRDSGIWWHLDQAELSIRDAAKLVGSVSDNLATNVLIARLGGVAAVEAAASTYGIAGYTLHDIVRDERDESHPAILSTGSAQAYSETMSRLWHQGSSGDGVAQQVLEWLRDGIDLSMVGSAFGLDPLAHHDPDQGYRIWNKTGTDAGVRVDVGIAVHDESAISYACLTNWEVRDSAVDANRGAALELMRAVGEFIKTELE